ncbi:MAG: hypothetical protein ACTHJN_15420 [Ginsengibacter sp.]
MKSKQINFFILPEDWESINSFLTDKNICFINEDTVLSDFKLSEKPVEDKYRKSKYKIYLTTEEFKDQLYLEDHEGDVSIDVLKSYAIEFDRGGFFPFSQKVLHRARLYAVTEYFTSNKEKVRKDECFIKWIDDVFRMFKKEFLEIIPGEKYITFSKNVRKWIDVTHAVIEPSGLIIVANS